MNENDLIGMLSFFIGVPLIVFTFVYFTKRNTNQVKVMQLKKEMLELEVRKEELHMQSLIEENKKYDRILENNIKNS